MSALEAWHEAYDHAIEAGCDPAEAVERADMNSRHISPEDLLFVPGRVFAIPPGRETSR